MLLSEHSIRQIISKIISEQMMFHGAGLSRSIMSGDYERNHNHRKQRRRDDETNLDYKAHF